MKQYNEAIQRCNTMKQYNDAIQGSKPRGNAKSILPNTKHYKNVSNTTQEAKQTRNTTQYDEQYKTAIQSEKAIEQPIAILNETYKNYITCLCITNERYLFLIFGLFLERSDTIVLSHNSGSFSIS